MKNAENLYIADFLDALIIPDWIPFSAWLEHLPFAAYIMAKTEPELFVELGTHYGASYAMFCEAVLQRQLNTFCFAVDTWEGDAHAGFYGNEVYQQLYKYHEERFKSFSTLLKMSFEDAIDRFTDGSIDLLHIDGYHTYEAVSQNFQDWLPKMSEQGIVLFHDVNVRKNDFGVWKLWDEIKANYPLTFELLHGHGLGIVAVGEGVPDGIKHLFNLSAEEQNVLRHFFSYTGRRWSTHYQQQRTKNELESLTQIKRSLEKENEKKHENYELLKKQHQTVIDSLETINTEKNNLQKELENTLQQKDNLQKELENTSNKLQQQPQVQVGYRSNVSKQNKAHSRSNIFTHFLPLRVKEYLKLRRDTNLIRKSGLFDDEWYLKKNPDVAIANFDPIKHYLKHGADEGRNPSPEFDTNDYLYRNPDVAVSNMNALVHYIRFGLYEGRNIIADDISNNTANKSKGDAEPTNSKTLIELHIDKNFSPVRPTITVIIPIYNAYNEAVRCLATVVKYTDSNTKVLVINDASTDERIKDLLDSYVDYHNVDIVHNEENLGYTATINFGIEQAYPNDVILLNSDTEVGPRWVTNLQYAAYRQPRIGTVTAISNNAGAFSVPNVGEQNSLPVSVPVENIARYIMQEAPREYHTVPTGSGFCLLIKRELLNEIGLFDADAFPRGYGEENDFCMRALHAGWLNVIDDSTYIIHERSASFGAERQMLVQSGRDVIDERYPEYTSLVRQEFFSENIKQTRQILGDLINSIDLMFVRPRILYVLSTKTGGTPKTSLDLATGIVDRYDPFILYCDRSEITLNRVVGKIQETVFRYHLSERIMFDTHQSDEYDRVLYSLLCQLGFELLHIRHIAWHSLNLPQIAKSLSIPVIFSFHDFYTVDPSIHLTNRNQRFESDLFLEPIGQLENPLWADAPPIGSLQVQKWRERMKNMLSYCDAFVTTSKSTHDILVTAYPFLAQNKFKIIPHGRDFLSIKSPETIELLASEPLKVLIAGNINEAKGLDVLKSIHKLDSKHLIEFHFIGRVRTKDIPGVYHGVYKREDFVDLVDEISPHISGIFSIWPETFSHTLTESLVAGLPVIVTPLGAQKERIELHGGGWILSGFEASQMYNELLQIREDVITKGEAYKEKLGEVSSWQQTHLNQNTISNMARQYVDLYQEIYPMESNFEFKDTIMTISSVDLPLPPKDIRWGGPRYKDDNTYVKSGSQNARMLEELCEISASSKILDIGCGQARLLHGLLSYFGNIERYVGIDVHEPSIKWLQQNIRPMTNYTDFHLIDVHNSRYNKDGVSSIKSTNIVEKFDCITLFSVFSHMLLSDIEEYFHYMRTVISENGTVFLTAFVEDEVEPETENPENYYREWSGPLHCVRLNRQIFEKIAWKFGFQVKYFKYRHTNDGQSSYVFIPRDASDFKAKVIKG